MTQKKILLLIFLSAAFLRIGLNIVREKVFFNRPFLYFGDTYDKHITSDPVWYDGAARIFLAGKGVVSMDKNRADYKNFPDFLEVKKLDDTYYAHKIILPLYPLFLALCYYIGGTNTLAYFIPQLILSCLTCLFIYFLTKEIFDEKVAVLAGVAVAFYPDLIFYTNFIRTETLFIFFLALGFWLLVKGNSRGNIFLIFVSAIIFGLACLTRVTFIPFIPLLFLWQIIFFKKDGKRNFKIGILIVLLVSLVLLPWCIRNYKLFGKFTPFTDEVNLVFVGEDIGKQAVGEAYYRAYDSIVLRTVMYVKNHFREYVFASIKRLITFWSPITAEMKPIAKIYKSLTWIIIFPLAFWGMVISLKSWEKSGLIIVFILFHSLLHAGSFVDGGLVYRYPIQPFLCIFTAYGFWNIYEKVKHNIKTTTRINDNETTRLHKKL